MAWYPLPAQSGGGTPLDGDEFFDDRSAGWLLLNFGSADDGHDTHSGVRAEKHGNDDDDARSSDECQVPQQCTQPADDIFMNQFSAEEMMKMDGPFEALDMFPGSMHQLLSYENMLSGVLTGSSADQQQQGNATLGVDTMDTCGFPLFSHDLQQSTPTTEMVPADLTPKHQSQDGASFIKTKRSRPVADDDGSLLLEKLVLQELEDVVFQLTKPTRVCFRDAFFRLAESSRAKCGGAADGTTSSSETGVQQTEDNASRVPTPGAGCPERATNAIDRTVADLPNKQHL